MRDLARALSALPGSSDEGCPAPMVLAAFADRTLETEERPGLEAHLARCGDCRDLLLAVATQEPISGTGSTESAAPDEASQRAVASARRKVAVTRSQSDLEPVRGASDSSIEATPLRVESTPSRLAPEAPRVQSGRRRGVRSGRHAAVSMGGRSFPLGGAFTAAGLLLAGGAALVLLRADAPTPAPHAGPGQSDAPATPPSSPRAASDVRPAPPSPPVRPVEVARPETADLPAARPGAPTLEPEDVVARGEKPAPPEPEFEPEPLPAASPPAPPVAPPRGAAAPARPPVSSPVPGSTSAPSAPAKPTTKPVDGPVLACAVEAVTGPVEIRKKNADAKSWRKLLVTDLVHEGDALRSRGEDGGITFASRARVNFDRDAVGTAGFTKTGVQIVLESGGLEGESLAWNGLVVTSRHGTVTAWQGSKVRVESLESGLRLVCDAGRAQAENPLGKVLLKPGQETTLASERKPSVPASLRGPRRSR